MLGINDLPLVVMAALATSLVAAVPFAATRRTQDDGRPRWWSALLAGAVIGSGMAYMLATLSPLSLLGDVPLPGSGEFPQNLNVVPVIDMLSTRPQLLLINLALLAPFGFLLQLRWPALGIRGVSLVSLVFAFVIETAQLFHPMRGTNVDDVLLNVLGAVAAGGLAMSIKQLGRSSRMTTSLR